jgi:hypothetical protein
MALWACCSKLSGHIVIEQAGMKTMQWVIYAGDSRIRVALDSKDVRTASLGVGDRVDLYFENNGTIRINKCGENGPPSLVGDLFWD